MKLDNKKIINLTVEEMPSGEIMAGAGAGSSGTSITGGIKEKNYLRLTVPSWRPDISQEVDVVEELVGEFEDETDVEFL